MNLNHVTIFVANVERSIDFYQQLGLTLIVQSLPRYARFECPEGDTTFSLHVTGQQHRQGIWVYFEVPHLNGYVEILMNKGIVFDELPEDKPWLWREARLKDPDNNQIILYHAGKNRKDPPWKIS